GYAFANVNAVPELDRTKATASFTFYVDPGRRVYVRKVNVSGNTKTRDEVIRREVRQIEGAWYDGPRIERSKVRVRRVMRRSWRRSSARTVISGAASSR
ncbi:MAG: hypothetical protein HUU21_40380, partial [Polyangiaceae bacterium]|nr:hypothetical protein [Polyangiaceae bacterium]